MVSEPLLRRSVTLLGMGSVGFGVLPLVSPRAFARLFGIQLPEDPALASTFRSIGARDIAVGMGIWSAASHGGNYAPWLLARFICDAGDALALLLAIRAGARHPRLLALTGLAAGAAGGGFWLWRQARARRAAGR